MKESIIITGHVPYQKCPICNGIGKLFVTEMDDLTRAVVSQGYKKCKVCRGKMIIPMHAIEETIVIDEEKPNK